jgi:hypothetical protein
MANLATSQQQPPKITSSYTIVRPRVFGAVIVPVFPLGGARSIPAQVGTPVQLPPVRPAGGREHPHDGSISTDQGRPARAVRNDPTLAK